MGGDAEAVARQFFARPFDGRPRDAFAQLAEDVVIKPSNGQIYIGHEGYVRWYEEQAGDYSDRVFVPSAIEVVRDHWVLMQGAAENTTQDGETELQPGCWLVHIRDGHVAAVLHYKTEQAAREALSEQR